MKRCSFITLYCEWQCPHVLLFPRRIWSCRRPCWVRSFRLYHPRTRRFGRTYNLHLQSRRARQIRNQQKQSHIWKWRWDGLLKRRTVFARRSLTTREIETFTLRLVNVHKNQLKRWSVTDNAASVYPLHKSVDFSKYRAGIVKLSSQASELQTVSTAFYTF